MMQEPRFPNFLVIGGMKCGTTSLHNYLNQHPEIFMSKNKEPNYFCEDRDYKTTKWYKDLFLASKEYSFYGESSIGYSKCHQFSNVPNRIKAVDPNMKLIYVVRNPIDRMVSEYRHLKWRDEIPVGTDINEYFQNFKNIAIQTSNYYEQIKPYLKCFKLEQILFLHFEEFKNYPYITLKKITNFLDLADFSVEVDFKKFNETNKKVRLNSFMTTLNKGLSKAGSGESLTAIKANLKKSKLIQKLGYTSSFIEEKLDHRLEEKIKAYLEDDMKKFFEISGIRF